MDLESILATVGLYTFTIGSSILVIRSMNESRKKESARIAPYENAVGQILEDYGEDMLSTCIEYIGIKEGELHFFNPLAIGHGRMVMCGDEEGLLSDGSQKTYLLMIEDKQEKQSASRVFEIPADGKSIVHRGDLSVDYQGSDIYSNCKIYHYLLEDQSGNQLKVEHRDARSPGGVFFP